mmetsp:Transcript_20694/g.35556  ORF Transcript_20694/g.35556 Transcript_20694/m.35556 type:complete len:90 (+) Transcript_20694:1939-2208(+)
MPSLFLPILCIPVRIYFFPHIFESFELIALHGSPEKVERLVEEEAAEGAMAVEEEDLIGDELNDTNHDGEAEDKPDCLVGGFSTTRTKA